MNPMEADETKLAKQFNWWWKARKPLWFEMRSAFLYELAARIKGTYEFGKPWPELSDSQKAKLTNRWPIDYAYPWGCFIGQVGKPPKPGWTEHSGHSYDLRLHDGTLVKLFLEWITNERKRTGIYVRQNELRRSRGFSWRPLELLDIQKAKIRALSDSERSQLSKTKKHYQASI